MYSQNCWLNIGSSSINKDQQKKISQQFNNFKNTFHSFYTNFQFPFFKDLRFYKPCQLLVKIIRIVTRGNWLDSSSRNHQWNVKTNWEDTASFLQHLFWRYFQSLAWMLSLNLFSKRVLCPGCLFMALVSGWSLHLNLISDKITDWRIETKNNLRAEISY